MKEILPQARKEKRAVGAFNIANYETAAAVLKAAEAEKSPVIIQLYNRLFNSNKAYDLAGMLIRLAHRSSQPVALHLDHGDNVGQVKDALAWGYTSVMYDGSRLPFDENVRITRFCVDYAKSFGASVEAEIGHVALKHSLKQYKAALRNSAIRDAVVSTGGAVAVLTASQLGDLGEALMSAKFSRKQEAQADDYGYDFLVAHKKNPWAMALSFEKLLSLSNGGASAGTQAASSSSAVSEIFSDHPSTEKRIATMSQRATNDGYKRAAK